MKDVYDANHYNLKSVGADVVLLNYNLTVKFPCGTNATRNKPVKIMALSVC